MAKSIENIQSELLTIKKISHSSMQFNIPRYQRLFVWSDEQIDTLLEDLLDAYKSKKKLFYLGGILIVKSGIKDNLYDLIDGQQRFTTLWLLSFELANELTSFMKVNGELRLRFAIRKIATKYFHKLIDTPTVQEFDDEIDFDKESSLFRINNARKRIKRFISEELNSKNINVIEFSNYIFMKVQLIITEVPTKTDLNKLFEVTNNRGIQLKHHEILKAKLLKFFSNKQERIRYGKIWDICSEMNNYIERNIIAETGLRNSEIADCFDRNLLYFDLNKLFRFIIDKGRFQQEMDSKTLSTILNSKEKIELKDSNYTEFIEHPDEKEDEQEPVRSILSFPQLLLHALRIYLFKNKKNDIHKISEKELLFTFKEYSNIDSEKKSKEFIELLFEVKFAFDQFIIKWVKVGDNEEVHEIKNLRKYNVYRKWTYYLQRQKQNYEDGFSILQSMLYHSQQITTHYWLTPLLFTILDERNKTVLFERLRKYDNILFCTNDYRSLPERTWVLMKNIEDSHLEEGNENIEFIDSNEGIRFPHYWFYKLEFILWFRLKDSIPSWKNFRMTAKNSVEHVSPQNPAFMQDIVSDERLNSFGNLALVARSINSEFSNKPFREKRERFLYSNKERVDSLKLDLIYRNSFWNDELCEIHNEEMKKYFMEYFNL